MQIREIIRQAATGEKDVEKLVSSMLEKTSPGVAACPLCKKEMPRSLQVCPNCKTTSVEEVAQEPASPVDVASPVVRPPSEFSGRTDLLAYARPGDRFVFDGVIPDSSIDQWKEYIVVPAARGMVSFSDGFEKCFSIPLRTAFAYPVKFMSEDSVPPNIRLYVGDRIKIRSTGQRGTVIERRGDGYQVKLDSVKDGEDGKIEWVAPTSVFLIDKKKTTKRYITQKGGRYVVEVGDFFQEVPDFCSALSTLFDLNRVAFNRYSKWLAEAGSDLDSDTRTLLVKLDPRIWGKNGKEG